MAYVYRHIRLDKNEPFYIGIGSDSNGKYKRAKSKDGRNNHWLRIVSKTDYKVQILFDDLTWEEANKKEIELVAFYGRRDLNKGTLVNLTDGGEGFVGYTPDIETRKKMSEAQKKLYENGYVNPMKGIKSKFKGQKRSYETRRKMSEKLKGKIHSEESRKKQGETLKKKYESGDIATWNKGTKGLTSANKTSFKKGQDSWNKGLDTSILCINVENGFIFTQRELADVLNIKYGYLREMLGGRRRNKTNYVQIKH
jgi:hypothetical protein